MARRSSENETAIVRKPIFAERRTLITCSGGAADAAFCTRPHTPGHSYAGAFLTSTGVPPPAPSLIGCVTVICALRRISGRLALAFCGTPRDLYVYAAYSRFHPFTSVYSRPVDFAALVDRTLVSIAFRKYRVNGRPFVYHPLEAPNLIRVRFCP